MFFFMLISGQDPRVLVCLFVCLPKLEPLKNQREKRERDSVEKETESERERGWMALSLQPGSD